MKKIFLVAMLVLSLGIFAACGAKDDVKDDVKDLGADKQQTAVSLLTQDAAKISKLNINKTEANKELTEAADIKDIAEALVSVKVEEKALEDDPDAKIMYSLDIEYTDGEVDHLFSDEAGNYFYRFI
ncbi:MAG: hypothetical protein RR396_06510, partial [Clostridiales bacterium]